MLKRQINFKQWLLMCFIVVVFVISTGSLSYARNMKIGSTIFTFDIPHFQDMIAMMKKVAKEGNFELVIYDGAADPIKQMHQMDDMIAEGVDGIYLVPSDSVALIPSVKAANKANIPVLNVDIVLTGAMDVNPPMDLVSVVGSDNIKIGQIAAHYVANTFLNNKYGKIEGKVGLIGFPSISTMRDRNNGFREEIKKYPGIEIVVDRDVIALTMSDSLTLAEDILTVYPQGSIDLIFASNNTTAIAFKNAIKAARRNEIKVIGVDYSSDIIKAIQEEDPIIYGTVVQYPTEMAKAGLNALLNFINGEKVEYRIPTKIKLVTPENVYDFEMEQKDIQEEIAPYRVKRD